MEIQISVRNLVEFILRSGNIDNRRAAFSENAMQEGGRIHRMIQRKMGADYHAEVFLRYFYETPDYTIRVEGRADGVMTEKNQEKGQTPGESFACFQAVTTGKKRKKILTMRMH